MLHFFVGVEHLLAVELFGTELAGKLGLTVNIHVGLQGSPLRVGLVAQRTGETLDPVLSVNVLGQAVLIEERVAAFMTLQCCLSMIVEEMLLHSYHGVVNHIPTDCADNTLPLHLSHGLSGWENPAERPGG